MKKAYPQKYKERITEIITSGDVTVNYMLYPGLKVHIISSPNALINEICDEFGVEIADVMSNKRNRKYVEVRFLLWYVLYKKGIVRTKVSLARIFNKHHATILHGLDQFEAWLEYDRRIQKIYKKIAKKYNIGELRPK